VATYRPATTLWRRPRRPARPFPLCQVGRKPSRCHRRGGSRRLANDGRLGIGPAGSFLSQDRTRQQTIVLSGRLRGGATQDDVRELGFDHAIGSAPTGPGAGWTPGSQQRALAHPKVPRPVRRALKKGPVASLRRFQIGLRLRLVPGRCHLVRINTHHHIVDVIVDLRKPVPRAGRNDHHVAGF
jgi:hypothetical protein